MDSFTKFEWTILILLSLYASGMILWHLGEVILQLDCLWQDGTDLCYGCTDDCLDPEPKVLR